MARKDRTVADRQKSLQARAPEEHFTLAGVRAMYAGIGGAECCCKISGHCRTQIFQFPRIDFRPAGNEPHQSIYDSPSIRACVVSNLLGYFTNETCSRHYTINPSLRHVVGETDEKIKSQQRDRVPVFVVVEEYNELTPVEMIEGECWISDEVRERDGEKVPALIGGREGEKFRTAWATLDGAWPEIPNNQHLVNMILAGVRAGQHMPNPIHKYVDQNCLVTDDGQFVTMMRLTMSARGETATVMDAKAYRDKASEIRTAIAAMEPDMGAPHMALLINSMYRDEYKDDAYQRLQYLRLWQSLAEAARPCLGYPGKVGTDNVVVAGTKTLRELKEYRDDIAHWWTDNVDENFLVALQQTINELIRRRYF